MSLGDAMQIASALWVKEAIGVPDLEFLTFDDWCSDDGKGDRLCLLHLQDYAVDAKLNADVKAADTADARRTGRPRAVPSPFRGGGMSAPLAIAGGRARLSSCRTAPIRRR